MSKRRRRREPRRSRSGERHRGGAAAQAGAAAATGEPSAKATRFAHEAMATVFEAVVVHEDAAYAEQCAHEAFREVDRLEQLLSRYLENSDVSRINGAPIDQPIRVGPEAFDCLEHCARLSSMTGGAFDVTIGSLLEHWSQIDAGRHPRSDARLAQIRQETGMKWIELDAASHTVTRRSRSVRVDLGGYGKGYAVDRMAELFTDWGVDTAALHAGASSVLALEAPPGAVGWEMTLRDPSQTDRVIERLHLEHRAVSASGLRRGRHIIDPRTGHPAEGARAAWAITGTAALSDALSTAFMVMSPAEIADFCENHRDVQAIVLPSTAADTEEVLRFGAQAPIGAQEREPIR